MWRPTPIRSRKTGLAAVKHQQAMEERAEQRGRAFTALARVAAAVPRATPYMAPHRPPTAKPFVGASLGPCCEHCRNSFSWEGLKRHYAGGCPALKAG
jgi:hypothetical protein